MTKPPGYGEVASSSEGEACLGAHDPSELSRDKGEGMKATRICKDCGETKPLEDFHARSGTIITRCKPCHREFRRQYAEGSRRMPQRPCEVSSGPFVAWLTTFVDRYGSTRVAAYQLGLAERIVWRWTHRPGPFVPETTVDRFFCSAGEPYLLRELYSELYEDREEAA